MSLSLGVSNSIVSALYGGGGLEDYIRSLNPIAYLPLTESPAGTPYLTFNGTSTQIDVGNDTSLQDLPDGGQVTWEFWLKAPSDQSTSANIISKSSSWDSEGYYINIYTGYLAGRINFSITDAQSSYDGAMITDDQWHHIAYCYDDGGTRQLRIFVDGTDVTTVVNTASGTYQSDIGTSMQIGLLGGSDLFKGNLGWIRISDSVRYTTTFSPPSRTTIPDVDANTVSLWPMNEGYGSVAGDLGANDNDGTITNGDWSAYPVATELIHGNNGVHTGVLLGQSQSPFICPYYDGVNDWTSINTNIDTYFNGNVGSALVCVYPGISNFWTTDGVARTFMKLQVLSTNRLAMYKTTHNPARLTWTYVAGGVIKTNYIDTFSDLDWFMVGMSWDTVTTDELKFYLNGGQETATQSGLGTWSGTLNSGNTLFGADNNLLNQPFIGYLAHGAIWDRVLTPDEFALIYAKAGI